MSGPDVVSRTVALLTPAPDGAAESIVAGAGWDAVAVPDQRLGAPGPFVVASELAGPLFLEIGPEGVVERQLADAKPPDGMRSAAEGVGLLLDLLIPHPETQGRLGLFVTHDAVLAVLVGSLYGLHVGGFAWPDYLDALVLWRDSDRLRFRWRGLGEGSHPIGG